MLWRAVTTSFKASRPLKKPLDEPDEAPLEFIHPRSYLQQKIATSEKRPHLYDSVGRGGAI